MRLIKRVIKRILRPLSDRWVYTARSGLAKGMKLRGGFAFLRRPVPKEETILLQIADSLQGRVVYDIGANVGLTTLFFARCVGDEGLVVAFEPVPAMAQRLRENVRLNRLSNVRIYEVALGDQDTHAEIHFTPDASGISTLRPDIAQRYTSDFTMRTLPVQVARLDTLVEREALPPPFLLKIDVEGFEYAVLQGAQRVIEQHHPQIFLELHATSLEDKRRIYQNVYDFINSYKYEIISSKGDTVNESNLLEVPNLWWCR